MYNCHLFLRINNSNLGNSNRNKYSIKPNKHLLKLYSKYCICRLNFRLHVILKLRKEFPFSTIKIENKWFKNKYKFNKRGKNESPISNKIFNNLVKNLKENCKNNLNSPTKRRKANKK